MRRPDPSPTVVVSAASDVLVEDLTARSPVPIKKVSGRGTPNNGGTPKNVFGLCVASDGDDDTEDNSYGNSENGTDAGGSFFIGNTSQIEREALLGLQLERAERDATETDETDSNAGLSPLLAPGVSPTGSSPVQSPTVAEAMPAVSRAKAQSRDEANGSPALTRKQMRKLPRASMPAKFANDRKSAHGILSSSPSLGSPAVSPMTAPPASPRTRRTSVTFSDDAVPHGFSGSASRLLARLSLRAHSSMRRIHAQNAHHALKGPRGGSVHTTSLGNLAVHTRTPEDLFGVIRRSQWVDSAMECLTAVLQSSAYTNVLAARYLRSMTEAERREAFEGLREQRRELAERIQEKRTQLQSFAHRQERLESTGSTYEGRGLSSPRNEEAEVPFPAAGATSGGVADSVATVQRFLSGMAKVCEEDLAELEDLMTALRHIVGDGCDQPDADFPETIPDYDLLELSYGVTRCVANRCACGRFANAAVDHFYSIPTDRLAPEDWTARCVVELHEVLNVCKQGQRNVLEEKDGTPTELGQINKSIRHGLAPTAAFAPRPVSSRVTLAQIYAQSVRAAVPQLRRFISVLENDKTEEAEEGCEAVGPPQRPRLGDVEAGSPQPANCRVLLQSCVVAAVFEGRVVPAMANVILGSDDLYS